MLYMNRYIRMVSNGVLENLKKIHSFYPGENVSQKVEGVFDENRLEVLVTLHRSKKYSKIKIDEANFDFENIKIQIKVEVPNTTSTTEIIRFISFFKQVFRHELEHYAQHKRKLTAKNRWGALYIPEKAYTGRYGGIDSSAETFFLHPYEIEAYVMEAVQLSKLKSIPLPKALHAKVKCYRGLFRKKLGKQEGLLFEKRIYETWLEYAAKRFPKRVINPV